MIHPKKIIIRNETLQRIKEDVRTWQPKGLESGGYILGRVHLPNLIFDVTTFIDGGPKAKRTPCSFSGDNEYATKKKAEARAKDPHIRLHGEYHLHPWNGIPRPSEGDLAQLKAIKEDKRPWYIIMLTTNTGYAFWDLNDEGTDFIEVPHSRLNEHRVRQTLCFQHSG